MNTTRFASTFFQLPRIVESKCLCRAFTTSNARPADFELGPQRIPRPATSFADYGQRRHRLDLAVNLMERSPPPRATSNRVEQYKQKRVQMADLDKAGRRRDFERQIWRKWSKGDVYAPHDLSPVEMAKHKKRKPRDRDVFDALGINPLKEYKNFSMMSEYMTSMGRIRHRRETGLRAVNQRKIAKAIRRAVGMGLIPSVHEHPEVLEMKAKDRAFRMLNIANARY